ncbi:bifunctional 3-(3-hydroxy-phenyl)propionate/3-hydroxycinnamic acid hydroxylase [Amycolatopsis jejuensis]|uniref:bifunctional 3-(3-hydroxy-phenyl)propionate/3-hydroxycinnamic acid hydroxylase n=1 Tax=Amycolatopsis jejuensis TaxID=330084 RepID=UPI0005270FA7|nr:bifunctional 3-(3-hydroxy-phenyl)propionate/3-hydroxycinnamic acid hydroxylase [Amycolatopsis jejuensis]
MRFDEATYDVLVAGYGPVGQILTSLLARDGHRIAVAERWPDLYPRPRAAHFDHEIHRTLDRLGVTAALGDDVVEMRSYDWRGADGELILEIKADTLAASGHVIGHLFYQPTLERTLHARLREAEQVDLFQGWELVALEQEPDYVTATLERTRQLGEGRLERTGEQRVVRARYVVGADGANSRVRTLAGIGEDDLGFAVHWLVADVGFDDPATAERLFAKLGDSTQWCDPRRPHMSARVGKHHRRWEFMLLPGERPEDFADADAVWRMLAPWLEPGEARLERHVVYQFSSRLAETMRERRILLAGDAAHVMPPFIGQGLCSGIRDAANLSWKLDLVLKGTSPDTILDSITEERYGQNRRTIEVSLRMGQVSCTLDPEAAAERDRAFRSGQAPPPEPMPGLSGGIRHDDPLAGSLGVQGLIEHDGRQGLADSVLGNGFCLITRAEPHLSTTDRETVAAFGIRTLALGHSTVDLDGRLTGWLVESGVDAVLVRPDFYVFGSVRRIEDLSALLADLRQQLVVSEDS